MNLDDLFAEELSVLPATARAAGIEAFARPQGVGASAQVATRRGAVCAGDLRSGDMVLTRDGGYVPVVSVRTSAVPMMRVTLPCTDDATGGSRQVSLAQGALVLLTDDRFPALFGTREVLVAADRLGSACGERPGVTVALARTALVLVDGLWIEAAGDGPQTRPMLSDREADVAIRLATGDASPIVSAA